MRYGNIKYYDISNGLGVRTSLFVSGCTHRSRGCFSEMTWDFSYGEEFTAQTQEDILKSIEPVYISGLTLLGGDPMEPVNQRALLPLLREFEQRFRQKPEGPSASQGRASSREEQTPPAKNIWCYTGYTYESDLLDPAGRAHCEVTDEFLRHIDILVDGEFKQELCDISLEFRGSRNQRVLLIHEPGCPQLYPLRTDA